MNASTIFNGKFVVVDAMIIIHFHALLALDKLVSWAKGEIVVEKHIKREAKYSDAGVIDLTPYIQNGLIIEEEIKGEEQERIFYQYLDNKIKETVFHKGEAACLALAISKGYGLACDERAVRDELKKKCQNQICTNSLSILSKARKMGLIEEQEANDLLKGLLHI